MRLCFERFTKEMTVMELNENIMQIITRRLNNEASPDDIAALDAWLDENPANRQEYDTYVRIWEESTRIVMDHTFDTKEAWSDIQEKIGMSSEKLPLKRAPVFTLKRLSIAAALIAGIIMTALYFSNFFDRTEWNTVAADQDNLKFTLPDHTEITLRKGSSIRFPENFDTKERRTELTGEAYFEVRRDSSRPFRVYTAHSMVEVLGTTFLVRSIDSLDQVVVSSGKVLFAVRKDKTRELILTKNQKASLEKNVLTKDTILNTNYLAWENGRLIFNNNSLKQVVEDISHLYTIRIRLSPGIEQKAGNITIKAEFNNEPVEQVMEELMLMTGLKITKDNGNYIFSD
ncbi:MAG: FecR domain-containing protein [Chitinophagales bacterium]|nr:FecR domain-containing protein [Chitinophagales bacterium]